MKRKASVEFLLMRDKNDFFTGFKFLGNTVDISEENYTFTIPDEKFDGTNNCLTSQIELFNKHNTSKKSKKFIINLYLCENIFHLYLNEMGLTFEIIFSDEIDFKESPIINTKFKFDNNYNIHRKRVSLINYNYSFINFHNFTFAPLSYLQTKDFNVKNSFQFSIYSSSKIIYKDNELFNSSLNIKDFYQRHNKQINDVYKKIIESANDDIFDKENLNSAFTEIVPINNEFNKMNFCKSKIVLDYAFDDDVYIEFMYRFLIVKLLLKLLPKIKNQQEMKNIISKYDDFKQNIISDKDLKKYQKIFGLIQANYIMRKYNCFQISYIKRNGCEKKSIFFQSIKFYQNFVNNLDEESPAFFKLLEINSKYGYYEKTPVYNFNLLNVEDIKKHLLELIPDVIFLFNSDTNTKAFSFSMTGQIAVNEKYLFEKYEKMDLIHNYDEKKSVNAQNIAMILSRYLIHEECGHTKFRDKSDNNCKIKSPIKCVVNGSIKKLTHLTDKNDTNDLIKIFPVNKNGKGDSGHYLETAFGQYKDIYTIIYFDRILNVGKLLNFPEYFVKKDKILILAKYMHHLFICEKNKIEINHNDYDTLEVGIYYMSRLLLLEQNNILNITSSEKKNINLSKDAKKSKAEIIEQKLEDLGYESSFTEENILNDIESFKDTYKEDEDKKNETKFLSKKRNQKMNKQYQRKDDKTESNKAKNTKPKIIAENSMSNDPLDNYPIELVYDDYIESSDDEACI